MAELQRLVAGAAVGAATAAVSRIGLNEATKASRSNEGEHHPTPDTLNRSIGVGAVAGALANQHSTEFLVKGAVSAMAITCAVKLLRVNGLLEI